MLTAPGPGWNLDEEGRFLLLPVAERDLTWVLECCREHAEGDWAPAGGWRLRCCSRAGTPIAFARFLAL